MNDKARVIVSIDDDESINSFIKNCLSRQNFSVYTADNVQRFFELLESHDVSICLIDLNLGPQAGKGFDLIKKVREKYQDEIKIIVISRRNTEADIIKSMDVGADDFLSKPIDDFLLVSKIHAFSGDLFEEGKSLPYYAVPGNQRECTFLLNAEPVKITEKALVFFSKDFVAKGSLVDVRGKIINKLLEKEVWTTNITETQKDNEIGGYLLSLGFDEDDEELATKVRKLLVGLETID